MLGVALWYASGAGALILSVLFLHWSRTSSRPEKLVAKWRNFTRPLGRVRR